MKIEAVVWKVPGPLMKEVYWLILGLMLEGQGSVGIFSGNRSTMGAFCLTLLLSSSPGIGKCDFWLLPSTLLAPFTLPSCSHTDPAHPPCLPWQAPLQSCSCHNIPGGHHQHTHSSHHFHPSHNRRVHVAYTGHTPGAPGPGDQGKLCFWVPHDAVYMRSLIQD